MSKTKLLLITSEGLITETIVDSFSNDFEVLIEYIPPEKTDKISTNMLQAHNADICVLNLSSISSNSDAFFKVINQAISPTPTLVLHHYAQKAFANAFIEMGAQAYLPVNFHKNEINQAIEKVLDGQVFVSNTIL